MTAGFNRPDVTVAVAGLGAVGWPVARDAPVPLVGLEDILRRTPRRYRLPPLPQLAHTPPDPKRGANRLAIIIENTRLALAAGRAPAAQLKEEFLNTLQGVIRDAMHTETGDTTFQAMVLRQGSAVVQEYVARATQQAQDSRRVRNLVNAFAHPAKLERQPAGLLRDALARLQAALAAEQWSAVGAAAEALLSARPWVNEAQAGGDATLQEPLRKLQADEALQRLQQLEALQDHEQVRLYRRLWDQQGPRANSHAAVKEGAEARRRGMSVETLAKQALQAVADVLNRRVGTGAFYRVATSMYVPAALAAGQEGGKTEWDAVLLKQAGAGTGADTTWDIELLVEAKASADAIATDFPRLLRGLGVLSKAKANASYSFKARGGSLLITGASLCALPTAAASLEGKVIYCSDATAEEEPRLLSAASRMQLLSSPESLAFASALAQGDPAEASLLEPLWDQLLHSAQWQGLLNQYLSLAMARALMVHTDDLAAAGGVAATAGNAAADTAGE